MRCTIVTEGFGDMVFELYPKLAPITVKNFVDTARSGFYDGLAWCRIVKMRCIETQMQLITVSVRKPIKSNMRCIETMFFHKFRDIQYDKE